MISPLAHIHKGAKLGTNVTVEPFAVIHDNTVIGDGTVIESHAVIMPGARIGKHCHIHPGAIIAGLPQDLKFAGEETTAEIGDNSVIREFATINRGTKANWKTILGKSCLIMSYAHIGHDCILGDHVILSGYCGLAGHVTIDDHAILEGYSAVQQFIHIGAHTFVAGGSKVRKNIPPYVKCAREPLSYIGVNSVGLTRRGFSAETIKQIEDTYRILYVKGASITTALKQIEAEIPASAEKDHIVKFIQASENGIMRGPVRAKEVVTAEVK